MKRRSFLKLSAGTLASGLLFRYREVAGVGSAGRWGLAHRLDRDTSGLLLVGRNKPAFDFPKEAVKSSCSRL